MNSKKNVIYIFISLILLLLIFKFGYTYLNSSYTSDKENENFIQEPNEELPSSVKKEAIDFTVYNLSGEKVSLSDFKGKKPVIVNFWASWCTPCKVEMPYFNEAYDKYSDSVEILMVNLTDGQRETKVSAIDFMDSNNYTMPIYFDSDFNAANSYRIQSIPRTIFISKDGIILKDHIGVIEKLDLNSGIETLINNK